MIQWTLWMHKTRQLLYKIKHRRPTSGLPGSLLPLSPPFEPQNQFHLSAARVSLLTSGAYIHRQSHHMIYGQSH